MRPAEDRMGAFEMFIADHFALSSESFNPDFRAFGLSDGSSVQVVFCKVDQQVNALAEPGAEPREFRWIGRLECQQDSAFEGRTLAIMQDPIVQKFLFELP